MSDCSDDRKSHLAVVESLEQDAIRVSVSSRFLCHLRPGRPVTDTGSSPQETQKLMLQSVSLAENRFSIVDL